MSIERMQQVAVAVPARRRDALVEWLYARRELHVEPFNETPEGWAGRFRPAAGETAPAEEMFARLQSISSFLTAHSERKPSFIESLFPIRTIATIPDIRAAEREVNVDEFAELTQSLSSEIDAAREERDNILAQKERLKELEFLQVPPRRLASLRHVDAHFVAAAGDAAAAFQRDKRLQDDLGAAEVAKIGPTSIFLIAGAASKAADVKTLIADYGLREIWLPSIDGTIADEMRRLDAALDAATARRGKLVDRARALSREWGRRVELALAYWDAERTRLRHEAMMASSTNVFIARGYLKRRDLKGFRINLERAFPEASLVEATIDPHEEPPVSLRWNWLLRPAGLIVRMFGLPVYNSVDPTPYLILTFLIFFGICFGDVLYGTMLIGISLYFMKRYKGQSGLYEFFRLFLYAGVSTFVFGVLLGGWAANLPAYFGENNPVERLRNKLMIFDPMAKPLIALGIAIGIGVVNQVYGLFISFLRDARRGDVKSGIFDGLFWIFYFAGLMGVAATSFGLAPQLKPVAWGVLGVSAAGLVLTQGRDQQTFFGKAVAGVISLYGITGRYGTTAFIGDVVSYSRLLALALTTYVVGMTFNIIAGLLRETPHVGWALFILVALGGHLFNFTVSILGAFVHSARLILLEWFGRFYESGGRPFRPYGFDSGVVEVRHAPLPAGD